MVSITEGIIHLVTAGFGGLGFSLIFNVRRELLPAAAFGGLLDWGVYMMAEWFFGNGVFFGWICFVNPKLHTAGRSEFPSLLCKLARTRGAVPYGIT